LLIKQGDEIMAATAENERVELFYFRLVGTTYDNEGLFEDYVPYGHPSPVFKGTLSQARNEVRRFHCQEDEYECGACIYVKRNEAWQKVESYLGAPYNY
jgi:hypothetical protein